MSVCINYDALRKALLDKAHEFAQKANLAPVGEGPMSKKYYLGRAIYYLKTIEDLDNLAMDFDCLSLSENLRRLADLRIEARSLRKKLKSLK